MKYTFTVGAAFESSRRFGVHAEFACSLSDGVWVQVSALDQDVFCLSRNLRLFTTHDSRESHSLLGVGDDEHIVGKRSLNAVERLEFLAGCGATDDDSAATQLFKIESM